jgi:hypothetical protein
MRLTKEILEARNACAPQAEIFNREFPDGMEFTREHLERCVELGLCIEWSERLIQPDKLAAYQEARATTWATYLAAKAPALAAYQAAYDDAIAPALVSYREAKATALVTYLAAIIDALVVALGGEE